MNQANKVSGSVIVTLLVIVLMGISTTGIALALQAHSVDLERDLTQYLYIPDGGIGTTLDLEDDITFEMWVKFESIHVGDGISLISKHDESGNNRSFYLALVNSGTALQFVSWPDGALDGVNAIVPWVPSIGTWYHVAVTKSDTSATFFINGVQQGTTQIGIDGSIFDGSAAFEIGALVSNTGYNIDGVIDDVRIWNIARTVTEIGENFSRELNGNEVGLVGYWKFNEISESNSFRDETVNQNDLSINNDAQLVKTKRKLGKSK